MPNVLTTVLHSIWQHDFKSRTNLINTGSHLNTAIELVKIEPL